MQKDNDLDTLLDYNDLDNDGLQPVDMTDDRVIRRVESSVESEKEGEGPGEGYHSTSSQELHSTATISSP